MTRPGAVTVRLLVGARREHRHVAGKLRVGELDEHAVAAGAPLLVFVQLVPGSHVREEVAVPVDAPVPHVPLGRVRDHLGLGVELAFLGRDDVLAGKGIVEEEIRIAHRGHGQRQVVVVQQPDHLVALHVVDGVVVVAGDDEHAVVLPLEGLLRAVVVAPHGGGAAAFHDVNHLVEGKPHRRSRLSGGDFLDPGAGHALLPHELHEGRLALAVLPPFEVAGAQVPDEIPRVDRKSEGLHPVVIGELGLLYDGIADIFSHETTP